MASKFTEPVQINANNICHASEEKFGRAFSKKAPIKLHSKALTAFKNMKQALISASCLVICDPTKLTEIWADASREWGTVWAVLMQDHG